MGEKDSKARDTIVIGDALATFEAGGTLAPFEGFATFEEGGGTLLPEGMEEPRGGESAQVTPEAEGRYTEAQELGRGGIERVSVAWDGHLVREVALKELLRASQRRAGTGPSSPAEVRFLREARVTGLLEHPSIVPVHELGQRADGAFYSP